MLSVCFVFHAQKKKAEKYEKFEILPLTHNFNFFWLRSDSGQILFNMIILTKAFRLSPVGDPTIVIDVVICFQTDSTDTGISAVQLSAQRFFFLHF